MATPLQMARRARLIELLRRVPNGAFAMRSFFKHKTVSTPWFKILERMRRYIDRRRRPQHYCNTSACVAGWAATMWPSIFNQHGTYRPEVMVGLLGLTVNQTFRLTHAGMDRTAKQKARQLERMV